MKFKVCYSKLHQIIFYCNSEDYTTNTTIFNYKNNLCTSNEYQHEYLSFNKLEFSNTILLFVMVINKSIRRIR
ncbi:hypothetical protein C922_03997 [Plasmodium inui San Antonio 1]|uniref:Uncharacterized protein n=1 Tax=Plasmodium inui San Antonio 1 TaxID=1237626 RepID=W7A2B1_9APIC|nr:hypothetical protein C922_03997 [Plasmodium inui San Antonio 1]EUD65493.1 hypothetical protein C922_03997 [Plasmodium inui San Antonio 1]